MSRPHGRYTPVSGLGALLLGVAAVLLLAWERDFVRRARVGQAVVIQSAAPGRSGCTLADVWLATDGRPVRSTLRAWGTRLRPGQRVRVLYLTGEPGDVVPDRFWQVHYRSAIAAIMFVALASAELSGFLAWRHRQGVPSLRDDYVGPSVRPAAATALPIDPAPRLWDREIDG